MTPEQQALTTKIGRRLHDARNAQLLSLRALSERTGGKLSKSRISNYEQGIRRLGIEEARILSEALGIVSPTYLLCLDDEGFLTNQERELLRRFRRTDARGRKTILDLAETRGADSARPNALGTVTEG